ncbi:MAG: TPM domain-containing protein, partial [Chloroflexi bacterium]|nr:TPM domain-containing protein [Chloroflexota bacterium]
MRRILSCIFLALLFIGLSCTKDTDIKFPSPEGYVNDFAYLLTDDEYIDIDAQLTVLEIDTSAEVVVVTIDSLEGVSIEDYAVKLFEAWDIGKKDKDNGILLLIAVQESETKIEVGYGLEEIITDGRAGRILDEAVLPHFKEGDYASGIIAGVDAIEEYIRAGTPQVEPGSKSFIDRIHLSLPVLIVIGVIASIISSFLSRMNIIAGGLLSIIAGIIIGLSYGGLLAT